MFFMALTLVKPSLYVLARIVMPYPVVWPISLLWVGTHHLRLMFKLYMMAWRFESLSSVR